MWTKKKQEVDYMKFFCFIWFFVCRERERCREGGQKNSLSQSTCAGSRFVLILVLASRPSSLALCSSVSLCVSSTPLPSALAAVKQTSPELGGWGIYACQAREKAGKSTVERRERGKRRAGGVRRILWMKEKAERSRSCSLAVAKDRWEDVLTN